MAAPGAPANFPLPPGAGVDQYVSVVNQLHTQVQLLTQQVQALQQQQQQQQQQPGEKKDEVTNL